MDISSTIIFKNKTMNILSFNTKTDAFLEEDIFSTFKKPEKPIFIQQGMSAKEISEVVSGNIIALVKKQFEKTKEEFEGKLK